MVVLLASEIEGSWEPKLSLSRKACQEKQAPEAAWKYGETQLHGTLLFLRTLVARSLPACPERAVVTSRVEWVNF
jgi:hypothetical protein